MNSEQRVLLNLHGQARETGGNLSQDHDVHGQDGP
jgi:hypothetical protein